MSKKNNRKVKIVATIGPATASRDVLESLLPQIDYLRFNFSHSTHEIHKDTLNRVLEIKKDMGLKFETMADIEGPKIRLGNLPKEISVQKGQYIKITGDKEYEKIPDILWCDYHKIHADLMPGDVILVDNGYLELQAEEIYEKIVRCKALSDGVIKSRKTLNLPEVYVDLPMITPKDREDLEFIFSLEDKFDVIAVSFVRKGKEIEAFKQELKKRGLHHKVFSKLEDIYAVRNIREIAEVSDSLIFARGDLGAESPLENLKQYQDDCLKTAKEVGTGFIIATQMMESMIDNPRPTRAEVIDVSYAVESGADGVWMSAETSIGKYPLKTVEWMHKIINAVLEK
jgi:pyruvate kinase